MQQPIEHLPRGLNMPIRRALLALRDLDAARNRLVIMS
jgi:hypothetical protein